jgi:DNA-binding LacI/PurR family transcriptional regulator
MGSRSAGQAVARLLINRGHRQIAFLSLWPDVKWSDDRIMGMRDVYRMAGFDDAIESFYSRSTLLTCTPLFERTLAEGKFSVWVCANDGLAVRALEFLVAHKIEVPRSISLVGFDNILFAFEKKLTTIDFNIEVAAYRGFQYLLNPGSHSPGSAQVPIEIEPTLIERDTTAREVR